MSAHTPKARKILLVIFGIIVAVTVIAVALIIYQKLKQPSKSALNGIPTDVSLILKIKDPKSAWAQDLSTTDIWKEVSGFEKHNQVNSTVKWLDSLTHTDAVVSKILREQPLYLSLFSTRDNLYSLLFSVEIPREFYQGTAGFLASIAKAHQMKETIQNEVSVWENRQPDGFSFYHHQGVFAGSFDLSLLKRSAKQIAIPKGLQNDKLFSQIRATEGKKSNISIYLNFNQIHKCLTPAFNNNFNQIITRIQNMDGWSNYDLLFRKDLILASGYFASGEKSFLTTLKDATKQDASFARTIDENTFYVYAMCISNFENFTSHREDYLKKGGDTPDYEMRPVAGTNRPEANSVWKRINPIQLVVSATTLSDSTQWLLSVKPYNMSEANRCLLSEMARQSKNRNKGDTTNYKGYTLGNLDLANSAQIFGDHVFDHLQIQYVAIGQNFIQFASTEKILKKNIDQITDQKSLENSYMFKSFCHDINPEALLLIYFSPFEGSEWLKKSFNQSTQIGRLTELLAQKTPYMGFKIGELKNQYFSSAFCWKYLINSTLKKEDPLEKEKADIKNPEKKEKKTKKTKKGNDKKKVKKETNKSAKPKPKATKKKDRIKRD